MPFSVRLRLLAGAAAATLAAAVPGHAEVPLAAETVSGNYLAGIYAIASNDIGISAAYFAEALEQSPDDMLLLENAFILSLAAGRMESAFDLAAEIVETTTGDRQAELTLGVKALAEGDYTTAEEHLERGASGPLAERLSIFLRAWSRAGAGDVDGGLALLDGLSEGRDIEFFRTFHIGLLADLAERHALATEQLRAAYDMDPGSIRVAEALIRALDRAGQPAEAEAVFAEVALQAPNHPVLAALRAELDAPGPLAAQITSAQAGAAEILTELGAAASQDDNWTSGASYLQLALHLDPANDLARVTLAEVMADAGQHEAAIALLDRVAEGSPLRRSADIQMSFALEALDRNDEARKRLESMVAADPVDVQAIVALGSVLRGDEEDEAAIAVYTAGIAALGEARPEHWLLYYYRGAAEERHGDWPAAEADLRMALSLRPDHANILNHLGYSLIDRGEKLEEALAMVEQAVTMEPTDGYIIDSLGWAYYRLGRYDDAVETLERAIALTPGDSTVNDHLGDAYWMVGRRLEARFQWNHALNGDPEPEQLSAILDKLQNGLPEPTPVPARADAAP